jgi:predicted nucleotidyltransferase
MFELGMRKLKNVSLDHDTEKLLGEAASSIMRLLPNSKVVLFGSCARGDYTGKSDLDICVLLPDIPVNENREIIAAKARCAIPRGFPLSVDITLYTDEEIINGSKNKNLLQYHILNEGVLIGEQ